MRNYPDRSIRIGLTESQTPESGVLPITLGALGDVIEPTGGIGQPVQQRDLGIVGAADRLADGIELDVSTQRSTVSVEVM